MTTIYQTLIVATLCTFAGCGSTKRLYGTTETTTTVEVRDRDVDVSGVTLLEIESAKDSTEIALVIIPPSPQTEGDSLPEESPPQPQIEDCFSELENEYSVSRAEIRSGIFLHTLEQKEQIKEIPFESTVTVQDSLKKEVTATLDYIEVPRDLTWWQTTQIRGFWILLMVILGYVAIKKFVPFA